MTIIQLEYLLAVANCGSFSLAAEHCFVTQPSLSMQIKSLEEELGVVLLDRSKKPVIATEAGEVVLERAPRDAAGLRQYPRIGRRVEGRNSGAAASGRHPDRRALPAAQVPAGIRARLSPCGVGGQGVDDARHRRCDEARPHRRRAGGRRHLRRRNSGAGAFRRPFLHLRFARQPPPTNVRTFASKTSTCAI